MIARQVGQNRDEQAYEDVANRLHLPSLPARLRIVDMLRRREECVCALQEALDRPQPYVSQQLRVLCKAGIVEWRRGGRGGGGLGGTSTTAWPTRGSGGWWRQPWGRQIPWSRTRLALRQERSGDTQRKTTNCDDPIRDQH
jgi:hypothetical protein